MLCVQCSKEDGDKDLLLRQAIASGQSEFIEKNLTPENTKKAADPKSTVNNRNKDDAMTTKVGGAAYVAKIKHKEPAEMSVTNGNGLTNETEENGDSSNSTSSKGAPSLLYSMLAGRAVLPPQEPKSHRSKMSVNGLLTSEDSLKEKNTTTTAFSNESQRSHNGETLEEGCLPDSTTHSNVSSPYNPSSVLTEKSSSLSVGQTMGYGDRTMSGSDLGYHSESASSLRDRLASNFTGYESESSSYMYESGADTSPLNVYSPDYPLSVLSSDGSVASRLSFMAASPSDSHSPFQNPGSINSPIDEAIGSPTYFLSVDDRDFIGNGYAQRSPGGSMANGKSDLMPVGGPQSTKVRQWSASSSSLSSPPQFMPTSMGNGEVPVNYDQRGVAFAKVPSPLSGFVGAASTTTNGHMLLPREAGPVQYTNGSASPQAVFSPQQSTSATSAVLFSDVTVASMTSKCRGRERAGREGGGVGGRGWKRKKEERKGTEREGGGRESWGGGGGGKGGGVRGGGREREREVESGRNVHRKMGEEGGGRARTSDR